MTRILVPAPAIETDVSAEQLAAYARAPLMPTALRDQLLATFKTFTRREIVAWICARADEEGRHPSAVLRDIVGPAVGVAGRGCVDGVDHGAEESEGV